MAGSRASEERTLDFLPGFFTNYSARDAVSRWKDGNWVRWHKGLVEKMGGYERMTITGYNSGVYQGVARALHDWSSLDSQQWIALGTNCKLHIVNNGTLYDITPIRKSSNVVDPFTTTLGSAVVLVVDPDHRAEPGDHVFITAASAVGGLTLSGDYEITSVVGVNSYQITASSNATSGATGGGGTTISYNIYCGLASNGEALGWGTGEFGEGTWGTPRVPGTGIPKKLRIWSLAQFGEDLLANPSEGALYWWDRTTGPNARATVVKNAPSSILRIVVEADARIVVAIGCTTLSGTFDPMQIRWCSQENFNDWIPTVENTAGGQRLGVGSRLVTGINSNSTILIWSNEQLYTLDYVGAPLQFLPSKKGKTFIVGPNAAVDANGVAYWMSFDEFQRFDGVIDTLPCDVHSYVFGKNSPNRLDKTQAEKVTASYFQAKNEIRWEYPSVAGSGEVDRYVIFNPEMKCWYYGAISRTAYRGVSEAVDGYMQYPYGASGGYLYTHEIGTDSVDGTETVIPWHLTSYDMNIGSSSKFFIVNSITPVADEETSISGDMLLTLFKKRKPQSAYETRGPYTFNEDSESVDVRCRGSQVAMKLSNGVELGQDFRLGKWLLEVSPDGGR